MGNRNRLKFTLILFALFCLFAITFYDSEEKSSSPEIHAYLPSEKSPADLKNPTLKTSVEMTKNHDETDGRIVSYSKYEAEMIDTGEQITEGALFNRVFEAEATSEPGVYIINPRF